MKKVIAIAGVAASLNSGILLIDEFETGIPISEFSGPLAGTYAITKAGAFGTTQTFSNIYQFFLEGTT